MVIVTHTSPDWDAIASCWLLQRYGGLADARVAFVNTGAPDPDLLVDATAVVDTGRVLDPVRFRFDHHQLPGQQANEASAALLVWRELLVRRGTSDAASFPAIEPLIRMISAGDTGSPAYGAAWSRTIGIHALLSQKKAERAGDQELLAFGYALLDLLAASFERRAEARRTLSQHTVYTSEDGLFVALRNAPQGATFAAFEEGARLVLFQSALETPDGTSHAIGLMRAAEWQEPHCGTLVSIVLAWLLDRWTETGDIQAELSSWYRHEAGFFAGRGTAKAPDYRPILVDLASLAQAFDQAWERTP